MSLVRVRIETARPYEVVVGPGALDAIGEAHSLAVLTDETVDRLHGARLPVDAPRLALPPGEAAKSFATLERVLDFLVAAGLDRSSTLAALGGGVVGDLGGLAASLFMRGIALVHCPTTLLAQCDSAVGGKTAVNLAGGKNLAGTFWQPRAVLADTLTLATLPERELRSGFGEVVKTALVGDAELLELVEQRAPALLSRDAELLAEVVARCARVKGAVVAADEREAGERRKLNLGHTFGHAIERVAGYGVVPHGEAVATGLVLAAGAAARTGVLSDPALPERLGRVFAALGLAPTLADLRTRFATPLAAQDLVAGMRHDKKGRAGAPEFVLPRAAGRLECGRALEPGLLLELLA